MNACNPLKVICIFVILLFSSFFSAFAQQKMITGKVTNSVNNSPLPGATVLVTCSSSGTMTDSDGNFSISVPASATSLNVSAVGFETRTVSITANQLEISLVASTSSLDEVVVVGYGTVKKRDVTGSIVSLQAKDFNQGIAVAPDQLIQGKTPGVMVINNTGQPGGSTTVSVRGNSSIRAGNNPLFVLDGIPLSGGSARPGGSGGFGSDKGNPLTYLNPNDIASIDILKDASATAIFGSRGANGVVMINTKAGISGDPTIQFNASAGISNLLNKPEVLSADQFREALNKYTPVDAANNDWVVYRYADVLMMKAEAILRGGTGTPADALAMVNSIRSNRNAAALASLSLDNLIDERGREFYWEGWRRQDLIRFGKFLGTWETKPEAGQPKELVYALPSQQLSVNPVLEQNPGY